MSIAPATRDRMLRAMDIEPLVRRAPRAIAAGQQPAAACLLLVPVAARADGLQKKLVEQIRAAAGHMLGDPCRVQWLGADAEQPPDAAPALVLGRSPDALAQQAGEALPAPADLLARPADKRKVWQTLCAMRRRAGREA